MGVTAAVFLRLAAAGRPPDRAVRRRRSVFVFHRRAADRPRARSLLAARVRRLSTRRGAGAEGLCGPAEGRPEGGSGLRRQSPAAREYSDLILSRRDLGVMRVVSTDAFHQRQQAFQQQLEKVRREEGMGAYLAKLSRVTSQSKIFFQHFSKLEPRQERRGRPAAHLPGARTGAEGFAPLLHFARENCRSIASTATCAARSRRSCSSAKGSRAGSCGGSARA